MFAEKRYSEILKILEKSGTVSIQHLIDTLGASPATIRRDLAVMDSAGRIRRVRGGASLPEAYGAATVDDIIEVRSKRNWHEKEAIAQYAASLIKPDDFVYIDAGTSTAALIEKIKPNGAEFVTNAIFHANALATKGCRAILVGGVLKSVTEAIIGSLALKDIEKYNFTKGFFGTNGITRKNGFSTPDTAEAALKKHAMSQCRNVYVLADPSKFSVISSVTFRAFSEATIITTKTDKEEYSKAENIVEVDKL